MLHWWSRNKAINYFINSLVSAFFNISISMKLLELPVALLKISCNYNCSKIALKYNFLNVELTHSLLMTNDNLNTIQKNLRKIILD